MNGMTSQRGWKDWNGTNSYQILAVDTSLITREECKCWSIEVKSWKTTDEGDVEAKQFVR